jgi:hypothetical protein
LKVEKIKNKKGLTMGKKKALLENTLTFEEQKKMRQHIKEFNRELEKEIEEQYPDDFNTSIMMDPE